MWLAEAIPPAGPVFVPALQALFLLAAVFVAIGMVKLADAIVRAFFGTVEGTVGWIPFAGKVVTHKLHKIEQKVTHSLGHAERKLDEAAALGWHNMARLVAFTAHEIAGAAETAWHLAQQAKAFVRHREVTHEIKGAVKPLKATDARLKSDALTREAQIRALNQGYRSHVIPQGKTAAWEIEHVLMPGLEGVRDRERALELDFGRLWKWVRHRKISLTTGAFLGAFVWAMGKLGLRYLRCSRSKAVQKELCSPKADYLLSLLEGGLLIVGTISIVELAKELQDEAKLAVTGVESLIREKTG